MKILKKTYLNIIISIVLILFSIRRIIGYNSNPSNYNEVAMFLMVMITIIYILCSIVVWNKLTKIHNQ